MTHLSLRVWLLRAEARQLSWEHLVHRSVMSKSTISSKPAAQHHHHHHAVTTSVIRYVQAPGQTTPSSQDDIIRCIIRYFIHLLQKALSLKTYPQENNRFRAGFSASPVRQSSRQRQWFLPAATAQIFTSLAGTLPTTLPRWSLVR